MSKEVNTNNEGNDDNHESKRRRTGASDDDLPLCEADVGICEYVGSKNDKINAIIKHRFGDFLVNEVDINGHTVRVESDILSKQTIEGEAPESVLPAMENTEEKLIIQEVAPWQISPTDQDRMNEILGEIVASRVIEMVKSKGSTEKSVTTDPIPEKSHRAMVHNTMSEIMGKLVETSFDSSTQGIMISYIDSLAERKKRKWRRQNKLEKSDSGYKDFLHMNMLKVNRDTMDCCSQIANFLRIHPKRITIAGTKDKRGITCQKVCLSGVTKPKVLGIVKDLRRIYMGNLEYKDEPLRLGLLKGNEFIITLRNVEATDDVIEQSFTILRDVGFINYFGMQRFGTFKIGTHEIGAHLLKGNVKEAVRLIMHPGNGHNESQEARKLAFENPPEAFKLMPKRNTAERHILQYFVKHPDQHENYRNAFHSIPRNLRLLYLHSYQSFIWNLVTSFRISKLGTKPVVGDLVFANSEHNLDSTTEMDGEFEDADVVESNNERNPNVKVLTEADLDNYSISDIILPTPGIDVEYPQNECKDAYLKFMTPDGLDPFNMRMQNREMTLFGTYRRIISKPESLSWKICCYNDPDQQLILSDLDKINGNTSIDETKGEKKAIIVHMRLNPAQYATMALREITKADTSGHHQRSLTLNIEYTKE